MNFEEIKELIKLVSKTGVGKVQVEKEDCKVVISGSKPTSEQPIIVQSAQPAATAAAPIAAAAPAPAEAPQSGANKAAPKEDDNLITIKSPMIGTFYRSAGPDKDPFMNVGSTFTVGDKLCIIEAMKIMNEIEAEKSGKITEVVAKNGEPVEFNQTLFIIDPT